MSPEELELKTQLEILKTDMGKVQASLRDAIVARESTHKILLALFEKTLDKIGKE